MARNNNIVIAFVAAVVLVMTSMCVDLSAAAAPLVRSGAPSDQDRVLDFTVSESKDSASWTAFGREWIVQLELSNVVEDNTDYYHGTLEGDESAVVSFALLPGLSLSGMIATAETTWWIRAMPVIENNLSEEEADLGIFMVREQASLQTVLPSLETPLEAEVDADVDSSDSSCTSGVSVDDASSVDEDDASAGRRNVEPRVISTYKVGVFFDQKWASASINPWASQADTLGLFNDVNAIYKAAGLGQFQAVYGKQVSNSKTTLNDMLTYFANTASQSIGMIQDTSYTNYIWLIGQNVGGLAYVGTTCSGSRAAQKQKTAVAGLVSYSRLFTVKTIAHELGHNRGAVHEFTNACTSTLKTGCQCSVMSYCFPTASNNPRGAVNFFSDSTISKMKSTGCY